ncbi:MAG: PilZ domain-containing protein [Candidatus Solibacter usitatus]|nr:PilZ domain-containing protein [Candidatus Solibacter usitatus]
MKALRADWFWRIMQTAFEKPPAERRTADRFPIEREMRFKMLSKKDGLANGIGKTVNISSAGVLFITDRMLLPGRRLEVAINWPAQLNEKCALKLVARGRIVRFDEGRVAMEIQQYEFRTSGSGPE